MPYQSDVMAGIQRWFVTVVKDGNYSNSNVRKDIGKRFRHYGEPETLWDAYAALTDLDLWFRSLDDETLQSVPVVRVGKRVRDLLKVVRCARSREGFSIVEATKCPH